jgi:uncharacterized protein YgiM (DUF1202 family)
MPSTRFWTVVLLAGLAAAGAPRCQAAAMSVQVKKAELRSEPSFLSDVAGTLSYGENVNVIEQKGAWMRVTALTGQSPGWIHSSALTKKNLVLKSGEGVQTGASSGELALAGKGFNSAVESQFKASHKDIDFKWVDRMEKWVVPAKKAETFLADGGLTPGKAGAP